MQQSAILLLRQGALTISLRSCKRSSMQRLNKKNDEVSRLILLDANKDAHSCIHMILQILMPKPLKNKHG